ncbi:unnamed protein product, partial [Symbiodinium sp. CCMP2456]
MRKPKAKAKSKADPAKPKAKAKAKGKAKSKAKAAKSQHDETSKESNAKAAKSQDSESSKEAPGSPSDEVDKELEEELEKEMLADDKPDALVEAVPRKRICPDDDDDEPKPPRKRREGPAKTFANRPMPSKDVWAKQRFESIRDAYQLYCQPRLKSPSTHADAFWKHCFELVGPGKKADGLALKKICKERAESFL